MVNVTAATSFFGSEGMWRAGDTKSVSAHRAHELIQEGLAIESSDQTPPSPLQAVADAIGATVAEAPDLTPAAEALGAAIGPAESDKQTDAAAQPVTHESVKPAAKAKPKPGPTETK